MRLLFFLLLLPTAAAALEPRPAAQVGDFIQHLSWSPDGKSFLVSRIHKGKLGLWTIGTGGETVTGRENFKKWIEGFLATINDLHLEVLESFQNADGSRVASRWRLTGKNNGFAGTAPDQQDIEMTGTAVWAVREDGKLLSNHVERAALEQLQRLTRST